MMNTYMTHRLLMHFESATASHQPDWLEAGSNVCLYFLRTALGSYGCLPKLNQKEAVEERTYSQAVRVFAGFIAFTLWLPITFVGIVLWACSSSHAKAYEMAWKDLRAPPDKTPVPIPPVPVVVRPPPMQPPVKPQPKRTFEVCRREYMDGALANQAKLLEEATKFVSKMSREALTNALRLVVLSAADPSTVGKTPIAIDKLILKAVIEKLCTVDEQTPPNQLVKSLFRIVPDERLLDYLPELLSHPEFVATVANGKCSKDIFPENWGLTKERCFRLGSLLATRIVTQDLNLWNEWGVLNSVATCSINSEYKIVSDATDCPGEVKSLKAQMMNEAHSIIHNHPKWVGELNRVAKG